ncbi:MAG: hypothetical protein QOD77_2041 [Thermoplasmata archaeon]|jgi:tRNA nucleotidyltransferase (CCA-adding enzyme)|nr:hypothetical protein [Thermoplasmata archaeon]
MTTPLEAEVLARITPTPLEAKEMQAVCDALVAACAAALAKRNIPGHATVQGSVAKGTWLAGGGDIDLFLLLDPSYPEAQLERAAVEVGTEVLTDARRRYAQHPYLMGTFQGRQVDLVPAYAVPVASAKMSAVDRTPFHTAWVRATLTPAQQGEARLLKRWLKGTALYGAQTAIGGFSGYLVEVLVARFRSFHGVLKWLAADAQPRRIALGPDQVTDEVAVLVVVDPVDPGRNCAAAVQAELLERAREAATAYLERPDARFFFPAPPRAEPADKLRPALARQGAAWLGLVLRPRTDRLDLVFPQFQKAGRTLAAALEEAGFAVRRWEARASPDEREALLQFVVDGRTLPATRLHVGPVDDARPHAERFRAKWTGHADAAGPVHAGPRGSLQVEVRESLRTATAWLPARLPKVPLGRHVEACLPDAQVLLDPADAPAAWAPAVADLVLDRRSWQR